MSPVHACGPRALGARGLPFALAVLLHMGTTACDATLSTEPTSVDARPAQAGMAPDAATVEDTSPVEADAGQGGSNATPESAAHAGPVEDGTDATLGDEDAAGGEAGSPGSDAGADGESDAGADGEVEGTLKPKCMEKDSQLIVIGDSYINWISHTFPDDIQRESGQAWRMEAVGGTSMGSGGIGSIPQQFYDSIAADPDAHTVLMDGGGNDVLVPDFSNAFFYECTSKGASSQPNCQKILETAIAAAEELRDRAAAAGIRDVVYFFYPHVPANTILSGDDPAEMLDYALPKVRDFCESMLEKTGGKTRCTFIDMIPVFDGHMDWFNEDIHENSMGSAAMAKEIWRVMSDKCIGQKGPKDCCES